MHIHLYTYMYTREYFFWSLSALRCAVDLIRYHRWICWYVCAFHARLCVRRPWSACIYFGLCSLSTIYVCIYMYVRMRTHMFVFIYMLDGAGLQLLCHTHGGKNLREFCTCMCIYVGRKTVYACYIRCKDVQANRGINLIVYNGIRVMRMTYVLHT